MAREIGSPVRGDGKIDAFIVVFKGTDGYRMMGTTAFVESDYQFFPEKTPGFKDGRRSRSVVKREPIRAGGSG